jgi:putative hydrolase of the HAD superfamily
VSIRAVTFDVGGTLIEPFPSVGAVYAEVARGFGIECCPDTLTRQFAEAWVARTSFEYSRLEWFDVVRHSFRGFAEVSEGLFTSVYDRFTEAAAWKLFDDALPALEMLRERGLRLAVISNWDDRLEPLLERLGVSDFFEQVTVSGKLGWHKPHLEVFAHTLRALRLPPESVLHVGDSEREDVAGARAAGLSAARVRRTGVEKTGDISDLTEIANVLDCLER